jgi:predicted RNase H-like HicB family nuclease
MAQAMGWRAAARDPSPGRGERTRPDRAPQSTRFLFEKRPPGTGDCEGARRVFRPSAKIPHPPSYLRHPLPKGEGWNLFVWAEAPRLAPWAKIYRSSGSGLGRRGRLAAQDRSATMRTSIPAGGLSLTEKRLTATMGYRCIMNFKIETDREADGRWIAEVPTLPGVMAYGKTKNEAVAKAQALALRVLADRLDETRKPSKKVAICA